MKKTKKNEDDPKKSNIVLDIGTCLIYSSFKEAITKKSVKWRVTRLTGVLISMAGKK